MLAYHGKSLVRALIELFPEVPFERRKFFNHSDDHHGDTIEGNSFFSFLFCSVLFFFLFSSSSSLLPPLPLSLPFLPLPHPDLCSHDFLTWIEVVEKGWNNEEQRRRFFEDYAKTKKFDALVADNWYLQSPYRILSIQVDNKWVIIMGIIIK